MPTKKRTTQRSNRTSHPTEFPIVGIGASAGGLAALSELLNGLPADPNMAFVIISHMHPGHQSMLAPLLADKSKMPVQQAANGTKIELNQVYVIQPDEYITLKNGVLRATPRNNSNVVPTVIDHFFGSLALDRGTNARGVVLSGVGSDGTEGLKLIREHGGITFAQEPHDAQFDGMPSSAIRAGCVDFVLAPRKIAAQLLHGGRTRRHTAAAALSEKQRDYLNEILAAVLQSSGVDFSQYKLTSLRRRITRRMELTHQPTLAHYADYLRGHPEEAQALHNDSLIHVSGFFRDASAFRALTQRVIKPLAKTVRAVESIRVWVPGCARGEEVYSIGMLLLEEVDEADWPRIQLFGSDVSAPDVEVARTGRFPAAALSGVSGARRRRFFVKVDDDYQIRRELRQLCIFACHDVGSDPPFSRLDLISCRNLLIYFSRPLQDRVIETFHYALKPGGYLFLGRSESLLGQSDLFTLANRVHRIYVRKSAHLRPNLHVMRPGHGPRRATVSEVARIASPSVLPPVPRGKLVSEQRQQIDQLVLQRYSPPGFYVDPDLKILSFLGDVSPYLRPSSGQVDLHISKMLPADVVLDIRTAIASARKSRRTLYREGVTVAADGEPRTVNLVVIPVARTDGAVSGYLVLFEPVLQSAEPASTAGATGPSERRALARAKKLLSTTRDQLRAVIEERDKSVQELTTAHEELLTGHEELQSSNEELETAKEELQSDNEELTTVNDELRKRNEELDRLTGDLSNLIAGANIPIVNLDRERTVLRFSTAAKSAFHLIDADIGRSFDHIKVPLAIANLDELITQALSRGNVIAREVQDKSGRWQLLRIRPYKSSNNWIDGAFIALVDIDTTKRRAAAIVDTIHEPLLVLDAQMRVLTVNPAFCRTFDLKASEAEGTSLFKLGHGEWDVPELRKLLKAALPRQKHFEGFRFEYKFRSDDTRVFLLSGHRLPDESTGTSSVLIVFDDVTEREAAARELRALTHRLREEKELADKRLAHELHDISSEGFAGLGIELARLATIASSSPQEVEQGLRALEARVSALAHSTHELARRLHPSVLNDLGLTKALTAECQAFQERTSIRATCRIRPLSGDLPESIALCVYRVTQEALRNVAAHAKANHVKVALRVAGGKLSLIIQDDGIGFDSASRRATGGLGLVSITERAATVGGTVSVRSKPNAGTTVTVVIPLNSPILVPAA